MDDWQFWSFTRQIASSKYYPSKSFEKSLDIVDCGEKIKATEGVDRFYHTLEFIALKNRIVKLKIFSLIDEVLSEL